MSRSIWTRLTDKELLAQCQIDTYRASGPGGQKRNKTSSAVRLRHQPSGIRVIAEESRSQFENHRRALRRLRQEIYLRCREPFAKDRSSGSGAAMDRLPLQTGPRSEQFWEAAARTLDALTATEGHLRQAAVALGVSTATLVSFLRREPKVWTQANRIRQEFGLRFLRAK